MFYSIHFDVVGPGVLLLFGLAAFLVFSGIVFGIEAGVLWLLKWGTFGRSLFASFLMNLASTIVGILVPAREMKSGLCCSWERLPFVLSFGRA